MPSRRLSCTFQLDTSGNAGEFQDVHLRGNKMKDAASRRGISERGEGKGQKNREMLKYLIVRSKKGLFLLLKYRNTCP